MMCNGDCANCKTVKCNKNPAYQEWHPSMLEYPPEEVEEEVEDIREYGFSDRHRTNTEPLDPPSYLWFVLGTINVDMEALFERLEHYANWEM